MPSSGPRRTESSNAAPTTNWSKKRKIFGLVAVLILIVGVVVGIAIATTESDNQTGIGSN